MRGKFAAPTCDPLGPARPPLLMLRTPFIRMVALSCIAFSAACGGGNQQADVATSSTEVNLVISDPATAPEQFATLIDFVSYRIVCLDSAVTPMYDDSVDIAGTFESDGNANPNPAIWTLVTDLPLSLCTMSIWVFYEDEVICLGSEVLSIVEDDNLLAPNKANVVLECSLSVNGPSGDLDVDGSYEFIHGNYCPKLVWLGAIPSVVEAAVPPVTSIETSSFDPDSTCGLNCDPQTCDFTQNPPVCTAATPDPGFSSTLFAPAGKGSFGTASAFGNPIEFQTTYTCDPLFPGPTELCAVASDGDKDCNQMRCITIICPDLCEGVVCNDAEECTWDRCDPLTGLCSNDPAPDGIACNNCNSTCDTGACTGVAFTAAQTGSALNFLGTIQQVDMTLVNPYSGASFSVSGPFNYNISSYLGVGLNDVLTGTNLGDFLLVQDPVGTQRICGVETILAQNSYDAMILADGFIILGDMVIEGGNHPDLVWANAGNDTVLLNNGPDWVDGGPGNDIIEGGNGNDIVTLWPGSGFDSISGGDGIVDNAIADRVEIDAIQSQILISPAADLSYEFDIFYLGTPMAQIREVEFLDMNGRVHRPHHVHWRPWRRLQSVWQRRAQRRRRVRRRQQRERRRLCG